MSSYDVIVVGLGGAGASAAYHLSKLGLRTLGLEQFASGHELGSSHGRTRIYRTAYAEGPGYVPLVRRAQELWRELQRSSPTPIIRRTGGLYIGRPSSPMILGSQRSAQTHSLQHEMLEASEIRSRYPQFQVADEEVALWDPDAGALFPENCIAAYVSGARAAGAELRYQEPVRSWSVSAGSVDVRTSLGEYRARSLVVTAGAWTPGILADLSLPLRIERQLVCWFPASDPELVRPDRMPVFIWDLGGDREKYGLPEFGDGVKVGSWGGSQIPTPEFADRTIHDHEAAEARDFVRRYLAGVSPQERAWTSCLYTMSPDHDFLIGRHPRHRNVVIISACSGHGYKFTSVLGEIAAKLTQGGANESELAPFDPGRFLRAERGP